MCLCWSDFYVQIQFLYIGYIDCTRKVENNPPHRITIFLRTRLRKVVSLARGCRDWNLVRSIFTLHTRHPLTPSLRYTCKYAIPHGPHPSLSLSLFLLSHSHIFKPFGFPLFRASHNNDSTIPTRTRIPPNRVEPTQSSDSVR